MNEQTKRLEDAPMMHGPGPWRVIHGTCNGWDVIAADGGSVAVEAWHGGPEHRRFETRFKADANLIAAAPDLLAACKAMLSSPAYGNEPSEEAVALAEAAIAKAEGRPQAGDRDRWLRRTAQS